MIPTARELQQLKLAHNIFQDFFDKSMIHYISADAKITFQEKGTFIGKQILIIFVTQKVTVATANAVKQTLIFLIT